MRKSLTKTISLLIVAVIAIGMLIIPVPGINDTKANAASGITKADIDRVCTKYGFENGSYWTYNYNNVSNTASALDAAAQSGFKASKTPYGSTYGSSLKSTMHKGEYWYQGYRQCIGLCELIGREITGKSPHTQWTHYTSVSAVNNAGGIKVGDVIRAGGHSAMVLTVSGSTFTTVECWGSAKSKNCIKYNGKFNSKYNTISAIPNLEYVARFNGTVNPQPTPTPGPTKDDVNLSNLKASEITADSCKLSCTVTDKGYTRYSCKFVVGNHEYTPTRSGNTLYCYVKRSELGGGYGPYSWHVDVSFYELGFSMYGPTSFSFIAQPWVETSFREITRADSNALCEMTFTVHDPSHLCTRCEIGLIDAELSNSLNGRFYIYDHYDSGVLKKGADGLSGTFEFEIASGSNDISILLTTASGVIDCSEEYYVSDNEGPEVYGLTVSNITPDGYDVFAKVYDESGLGDRTRTFGGSAYVMDWCHAIAPNNEWIKNEGLNPNGSFIDDDTINYHINATDPGIYGNYIFVIDKYGNMNSITFDVEVPDKTSVTPTPTLKPTAAPTNKPTTTPRPTATPAPVQPGNSSTSSTNSSSSAGLGDFIERLYNVALGRPSEAYGKNYWINKVKFEGFTGADVARGFLFSEEFLGKNMSNSDFLDTLYLTFFNRPADEHKADWMTLMDQGWTKMQVIDGFINSTEWANLCLSYSITSGSNCSPNINIQPSAEVESFARRLYTTCLGRDADIGGLNNWAAQLANMQISGSQAAHGFFFSEEFIAHGFNNEEYVNRLYRTFMGREADPAGFADWVGQLNNGVSRESVFQGFAGSQEWAGICAEYGILK